MAVPKRKTSKARRDSRRSSNSKLDQPNFAECPQCHALVTPHTVCKACGYYDGNKVVDMDQKDNKKA